MIRAAREEDAAAIAAIYAPHVTATAVSFETQAPDAAAMAARMAASGGLYPWLVAERDGAVLGYAYASAFGERAAYRWTVETTIYVAEAAHGSGVGRRLYGALLTVLERQGFAQAIGRIALPNPASVALHERLGFARAALFAGVGRKHGRWIDVGCWQRPLAPAAADAAEPRRFAGLDAAP